MDYLIGSLACLAGLGFSARYTFWRRKVTGIPLFMYHHITDDLKNTRFPKLRVSPKKFAKQLDTLKKSGYQAVTLSQALSSKIPEKSCVITFDDGYDNFLTEAWPLLQERDMTATVFLVSGQIGGINQWDLAKNEPQEKMLTSDEILFLAEKGIEFGGHTRSHRNLTQLSDSDLESEVLGCASDLTLLLGKAPKVFSYPFGAFNEKAVKAVRKAGFTYACTTKPGKVCQKSDMFELPRIIVKRADDPLDFRIKIRCAKSRL